MQGEIVWTDVEDRFYPLGLKAIGLFCEAIIREGMAEGDRYVVGFQRFPGENPYLGGFSGRETKVSFRVTPGLKRSIERGERPDLMRLVPRGRASGRRFCRGLPPFCRRLHDPRGTKDGPGSASGRFCGDQLREKYS